MRTGRARKRFKRRTNFRVKRRNHLHSSRRNLFTQDRSNVVLQSVGGSSEVQSHQAWSRSSAGERCLHTADVAGSIPAATTTPPLTAEALKRYLKYDPRTGVFTWRVRRGGVVKAGDVAGNRGGQGYWQIGLLGRVHSAHRLAWLYMTGEWPAAEIDHINMDRADNRWRNLRLATDGQNQGNRAARKDSKLGVRGVRFDGEYYVALIRQQGVRKRLGYFKTMEEAKAAYDAAAKEYFGDYARAG